MNDISRIAKLKLVETDLRGFTTSTTTGFGLSQGPLQVASILQYIYLDLKQNVSRYMAAVISLLLE